MTTTLYVTNVSDDTISVIDTNTNTVTSTVSTSSGPSALAVTPDGTKLCVTVAAGLQVFSMPAMTLLGTVSSTASQSFVAATDTTAYICDGAGNAVIPVDLGTLTAGSPITVSGHPVWLRTSPDQSTVYVGTSAGAQVFAIDTGSNTASRLATFSPGVPVPLGFDSGASHLYVGAANTIVPTALPGGSTGSPITVGGFASNALLDASFKADESLAWVGNELDNTYTPVSLPGGSLGTPVTVTTVSNGGSALKSDESQLYVADGASPGTVQVIDTATSALLTPISVGNSPQACLVVVGGGPSPTPPITQVQQVASVVATGASVTLTPASVTTHGNFLAAVVAEPASVSVVSVTDSGPNAWIRTAVSNSTGGNVEIWTARGVVDGTDTIDVTFAESLSSSVSVNVSEWAGVSYAAPIDQWGQTNGTGASPAVPALTPRTTGETILAAVSTVPTGTTNSPSGYTTLSGAGGLSGQRAAYLLSYSGAAASFTHNSSQPYATVALTMLPGPSGLSPLNGPNPQFLFPEVQVQVSPTTNWQAPLLGNGIWTDISNYVQSMSIGPEGRQHELDRVQATTATITTDNRSGVFNPWNTGSFLYPDGLNPMTPVKVTAAWQGFTFPQFYGYMQSVTTAITDVLNVDATIACVDILQILSLKYLSNDNYAQLIEADGGANLVAYYRLGDTAGNYTVHDSSGNSNTGSLISGLSGVPLYGANGAFLFDANTALDLTNGSNTPNGGVHMVDNTTEPPTVHDPLAASSAWSFECWLKWTGGSGLIPSPTASVGNATIFHAAASIDPIGGVTGTDIELQFGWVEGINSQPESGVFALVETLVPGIFYLYNAAVAPVNVFDGEWHHFVYSSASVSSQFNAFIDGQPVQTSSSVAAGMYSVSAASVREIVVGSTDGNPVQSNPANIPSQPWAGTIQDVALYSTALTATEVQNHYAQGLWFQQEEFGVANGAASVARFNKALAVAGLNPTALLFVPYQFRTELYAESNPVTTTSALNYLQTISETEPGLIFQRPDGMIYGYSRQYQYLNPTSTSSQGIIADNMSTGYHYEGPSLSLAQDDLDIFNDIQVQSGRTANPVKGVTAGVLQEWGPVQASVMAQSASVYGERTLQGLTSLQFANDSDALAVAQNYANWYVNPIPRVQQVTLNSTANRGANLTIMLQSKLMDRYTIEYQGQTSSPQFSQDSLIEQIAHRVDLANGPIWSTTFAMSPYEILMYPIYLGVWEFGKPASQGVLTL